MNKDKKISVVAITFILLALLGSIFLPEYKVWFNVLAIVAFGCTLANQIHQLYKANLEWKKYAFIYAVLCLILAFILFL